MVQSLVNQSPDIQKILAFEGAFEKLFSIVQQEGGLEGGPVVHDALSCVDSLLRFNSSNQVFVQRSPSCGSYLHTTRATSVKHHYRRFYRLFSSSRLHFHHMRSRRKASRFSFGIHLKSE